VATALSSAEPLYWDWNATTPPHAEVVAAMQAAMERSWSNASSQHRLGRAARAAIEGVREMLAEHVGVHPRDVLFTGSGTEANNIALRDAPALVVSRLDHPSVVRVAEHLEGQGRPVAWARVPEHGRLEPDAMLEALLSLPAPERARSVVALTLANHETGVVQDVEAIHARRGSRRSARACMSTPHRPSASCRAPCSPMPTARPSSPTRFVARRASPPWPGAAGARRPSCSEAARNEACGRAR
jgi:cysteine desulfurase